MAKHSVDVVVKARDEASRKFGHIGRSAMGMGGMIKKAAAIAAVYFGARTVKRLWRCSAAAAHNKNHIAGCGDDGTGTKIVP